jgi:hypothetical protein
MKQLIVAAGLLLGACVASGPPAPVPPPMAEAIPKPPVSPVPLTWQPGQWDWTGSSYVWTPGRYVDLAGRSGTWMPPFWDNVGSSWVWQPGHWM